MPATLPVRFEAVIEKSSNKGGWTYLVWPESPHVFGTRGLVKVAGTMDGRPFTSAFMPLGDGRHKLPVTARMLDALGKGPGDAVAVEITARR